MPTHRLEPAVHMPILPMLVGKDMMTPVERGTKRGTKYIIKKVLSRRRFAVWKSCTTPVKVGLLRACFRPLH